MTTTPILLEQRALILAPTGRDSTIAAQILDEAGVAVGVCADLRMLCAEMAQGAALALLAEEALHQADLATLNAWIAQQPPWSDFPFVLFAHRGGGLERNPGAGRLMATLGNVTFLERPFHPTTLVSVVQTALRGRRRQYEARQRMEALRNAESQFRTMAESIPQLAWMAEPSGYIFWYNQRWYDYTGSNFEAMRGEGWRSVHDPEQLAGVIDRWTRSLQTGERFEMVFPLRSASGEYRSFLTRVEPVLDADGAVIRWLGTNTDITDQLHAEALLEKRVEERTAALEAANEQLASQIAERERAEKALRQAQRLEAVGQLTAGVAHDFNNLLTVIIGNIAQIRRTASDPRLLQRLDMMDLAAERGARLTAQMLAFSRRQKLELRAVDLNAALAGMQNLLSSTLGGAVRLDVRPGPDLWRARIDATQVELAILNLAINARDAMPDGGELVVETANVTLGPPARTEEPPAGDYVMVAVRDSGSGMSEEVRTKAIEPFFTTKEVGKGSGLGLSQVFGLAKQAGGGMRIESVAGQGTTVRLYFPPDPGHDPIAHPAAATVIDRSPKPGLILVVDDDAAVRSVTAAMVADLGYAVVEAEDGASALQTLEREPAVAAVLLDYAMPGMSGRQVARTAEIVSPGTPIIFVTGYADIDALQPLHYPVLQKPVAESELARQLQSALA